MRRRILLRALGVLIGVPLVGAVAWWLARPAPPAGGPLIGLSMASSFVVQRPAYEDALARAGGRSVLLTPTDEPIRIEAMLDEVDAVLLTGGGDVDPALYEGDREAATDLDPRRDRFEIALIRGALKRDMPILGICRGIQILNVAHGGTLRNLREDAALVGRHDLGLNSLAAHEVSIEPGSMVARVIGGGARKVNSFHGQAVGSVGSDLRAVATADDGVTEAIERPDRAFVIGVQWHPEIQSLVDDAALALFRELVGQADAYRTQRSVKRGAGRAATE